MCRYLIDILTATIESGYNYSSEEAEAQSGLGMGHTESRGEL